MTPSFVAAVFGGAVAGYGIALLITSLIPAPPALGPALDRLYPSDRHDMPRSAIERLRGRIRVPAADLAILGRTPERYVLDLTLWALGGLALPSLLSLLLVIAGFVAPAVPIGAGILGAAGAVWLVQKDIAARAQAARDEFRRGICTYLDMAATQVHGGRGPMEALNRAASICHGWVFDRLREALIRADLQLAPPWHELKQLSTELGVTELGDLADIMQAAATEGAQVHETLRARADSLRDHIRTQQLEEAEIRTNKLDVPAAALILVLLVLMGWPFMARLFTHQP
jgi:Flp pilus assembly protein TadB